MPEQNIDTSFFDEMAAKWPSTMCARRSIGEFTGGLYSTKFLANEDSARRGPAGKIMVGGQVCYSVKSLVDWLKNRASGSWATRKKSKA